MAIDKAIDSGKLDREMLATANAIREKGKTEAAIPWEDEKGYAAPILALKGGADLNFEVVGGETEPTNPKENTIWVNTPDEITSWVFSAAEPENPTEGMVWFSTDTTSIVEFNALKENGIQVYPLSAKQYDGSAWVDVPAKIYQDGAWVEWLRYLYLEGDECENITGGWEYLPADGGNGWSDGSITKETDAIFLETLSSKSTAGVVTKNLINITDNENEIKFKIKDFSGFALFLRVLQSDKSTIVVNQEVTSNGIHVMNTKNVMGSYYIAAIAVSTGGGMTSCRIAEVYYG